MEEDVFRAFGIIISWLKSHTCWEDISFWDFSIGLFLVSTFCKIVFHNYESTEFHVDVEGGNVERKSVYH